MYSMNKILSLSVCAVGVSFSVLQRLNLCLPATFGCMVIKKNPIERIHRQSCGKLHVFSQAVYDKIYYVGQPHPDPGTVLTHSQDTEKLLPLTAICKLFELAIGTYPVYKRWA